MRKSTFIAFIAFIAAACSPGNERLLTSATGSIYECLVVGDGPVRTAVSETMAADMYGLPQMEPYFNVTSIPASQFDDFLKSTRNVLILDVNPQKYTQVKLLKSRDLWSSPQAVIRIQAPDEETLSVYWQSHGEAVREWFVREELSRQAGFYRAGTNKEARAALQAHGYDMLVPEDYMLIKNERIAAGGDSVDVVWCCNNKGPMRRDLVVYSTPYTVQEQFGHEAIIATRNAVLGQIVSAQVPGSYMGTEYKHFPPVTRQVQALRDSTGGFYAMETRGLWKIYDGEAMGGPFVSLTRLDAVNGRVVCAEAFLFAAGQKKRNALRQAEAVLYTLRMPDETAKEKKH
jgi:hypothetical protein